MTDSITRPLVALAREQAAHGITLGAAIANQEREIAAAHKFFDEIRDRKLAAMWARESQEQ